jgi:hypothetical protein
LGLDINRAALGDWVPQFVRASNRLAGITREPTVAEISAHRGLLAANRLRVENLEQFVRHVAGGAHLRDPDSDRGGKKLRSDLAIIVEAAKARAASPARLHRLYGMLHPFTDGNGRCGRALLMWQVMRAAQPAPQVSEPVARASARPTFRAAQRSMTM